MMQQSNLTIAIAIAVAIAVAVALVLPVALTIVVATATADWFGSLTDPSFYMTDTNQNLSKLDFSIYTVAR